MFAAALAAAREDVQVIEQQHRLGKDAVALESSSSGGCQRPREAPSGAGGVGNVRGDGDSSLEGVVQPSVFRQTGRNVPVEAGPAFVRMHSGGADIKTSIGSSRRERADTYYDDDFPQIPTDDLGVFMTTLVDGMRSDGVQLANSAKNVVSNTFQVRTETPYQNTNMETILHLSDIAGRTPCGWFSKDDDNPRGSDAECHGATP